MSKEELSTYLKQAQDAENAGDFFSAAHYYKETLRMARDLGDSDTIISCKNKVVDMNQKSKEVFKELNIEQEIPNKEINKVVSSILEGDLEAIFKKIGGHPFLLPKIQQVEESAKKNMPLAYQLASLSTISQNGHLVKGGADGNYSWIMNIYGMQQGLITELYLRRIFDGLASKGFSEESLLAYLRSRSTFPENAFDIVAIGINRYFAQDYVSALHILIPQFESIFLFMSEMLGIDTVALNSGKEVSTQLKVLSAELLTSEAFQGKWGKDFCEQLKFVLFEPLGYTLRHKVAHGQIMKEECTSQIANLILYFYFVLAVRIKLNNNNKLFMKELSVYNLKFPAYIHELNIADYKFKRGADYEKAFAGLQHIIEVSGSEFPEKPNTGTHQQTALVEIPGKEGPAILPWAEESNFTKLQDILLFLTLFIGRNVFVLNPGEEQYPLRPDPRGHFWGGQFRLSIRRDVKWRHRETGEFRSDKEMKTQPVSDYNYLDFGLEQTINEVMNTITTQKWLEEYGSGYFIFIFRQAMKQDDTEPAFLLCWTIWEHLFTLHNRQWLDDVSIDQTSGYNKIAFILNKYLLVKIDNAAKIEIKRIAKARNRLVHFGEIPDDVDLDEMVMFIRLTEQIMAIVLGLQPSNAFNSVEQLQDFLKIKKSRN